MRREQARWIWLAGLLEGEGYFGSTTWGKDGSARRPVLRVTLNMGDIDVVERAKQIVGSDIKVARVEKAPENWKDTYSIQWTGKDAETIMWAVLPYMGLRRTLAISRALRADAGHRPPAFCRNGHPRTTTNQRRRSDGPGYRCRLCEREASKRKRERAR